MWLAKGEAYFEEKLYEEALEGYDCATRRGSTR